MERKKLLPSSEGMGHGAETGPLEGPPRPLFLASPPTAWALVPPSTHVWSGSEHLLRACLLLPSCPQPRLSLFQPRERRAGPQTTTFPEEAIHLQVLGLCRAVPPGPLGKLYQNSLGPTLPLGCQEPPWAGYAMLVRLRVLICKVGVVISALITWKGCGE